MRGLPAFLGCGEGWILKGGELATSFGRVGRRLIIMRGIGRDKEMDQHAQRGHGHAERQGDTVSRVLAHRICHKALQVQKMRESTMRA